ncbi:MAG: hypothetical protein V1870_00250 [Candidatus Aenigmatarchaeota archaeon]
MKKVAFITYNEESEMAKPDLLLVEPLKKQGYDVEFISWDEKGVLWTEFDAVVLRSCWDYHIRFKEFSKWLDQLKKNNVCVWNSIDVVKWNANKKYLLDLQSQGISIVPTLIVKQKTTPRLKKIIEDNKWSEIIIKPVIGASSHDISRIKLEEVDSMKKEFSRMLNRTDVIIQPFMKEVLLTGEYSFIFFDDDYSHAVLKTPIYGDFRTQKKYGAIEISTQPNKNMIKQVRNIIKTAMKLLKSRFLYARVDCINCNGKMLLMELELIEPYLFFEHDKQATMRFVDAFKKLL